MSTKCGYIDMHCDTLTESFFRGDGHIFDGPYMQSISHMRDAGQMAQFFAVFFPPRKKLLPMSDEEFWERMYANFLGEIANHSDIIGIAACASEIETHYAAGRASAVLTIEDGRMVDYSLDRLRELKSAGVAAIALTWNYPNCFGFPNSTDPEIMSKGLTDFGREAVELMNDIGIMVDVSHLSDGGFDDVAAISKKPFIATHSDLRSITPHTRNLTDEMLRTLAEHGGVAGINFYSEFARGDKEIHLTRISDLTRHIMHMIDVGGEDVAALGTDFDGIDGETEISHPEEMYRLFDELKSLGLTERVLDKIRRGNVLRVMRECLG